MGNENIGPRDVTNLVGSQMQIPESVRTLQNIGPDEGHKMRIGKEIVNQLDPNDPNAFAQSIADRIAEELSAGREGYSAPSFVQLTNLIEKGQFPKNSESIENAYRETTVDLVGTLFDEMNDVRLHMIPDQYGLMRHGGNLQMMRSRLQSSLSRYESIDDIKDEKVKELAIVLNADLLRYKGIGTMVEHASVYQQFYYDGIPMYQALVTGRRIKVMGIDDLRLVFGKLKGADVEKLSAVLPEKINKGSAEEIKRMTSDQMSFELKIAGLNRFDPSLPEGQETRGIKVTKTEMEFLNSLFKGSMTENITVDKKDFSINLLSIYTTVSTEKERKTYEALMMSLMINNAREKLSTLPSEGPAKFGPGDDKKYKDLIRDISTTRDKIIENWDSLTKTNKEKLASWAIELNHTFNVATLNINDLSYCFNWSPERDAKGELIIDNNKKQYKNFKIDVGGPNTAYDAINIWLWMFHEVEYQGKARVRTPMIPTADGSQAKELIKRIVLGEDENAVKAEILEDRGLAMGAAILGLYGLGVDQNDKRLSENDKQLIKNIRGAKFAGKDASKMMTFNKEAAAILEKTILRFPVWVKGKVLPMPIKSTFDNANFLKNMVVNEATGETVFQHLANGGSISDIDFENYKPFEFDSWQVDLKMTADVLGLMYGQGNQKNMDPYFEGSASDGIGSLIKKMDIGQRGDKNYLPIGENGKLVKVNRAFYEITNTAYITMAYLAFVKHGVWNGHGNWTGVEKNAYVNSVRKWVVAAYTSLPENKGDFKNYRDSMVLMMMAVSQWISSIAPAAEKQATNDLHNVQMPYSGSFEMLADLIKSQ